MAVLTVGALIEMGQHLAGTTRWGIQVALVIIFFGGLITCWRRLRALALQISEKQMK